MKKDFYCASVSCSHGIYRNKKSNDFIVMQKYFQPWVEILINLLQFLKNEMRNLGWKFKKIRILNI